MKPFTRLTAVLLAGGVLLGGLSAPKSQARAEATPLAPLHDMRKPDWARPLDASFNLFEVSPTLYRSALPGRDDLPTLQRLKVKTVVSFIKEDDAEWLGESPIRRVSLPMHADRVDDDDVLEVLRIVRAAQTEGPVLIHCKHGRDRTGLVSAMYRIVVQGWSKQDALAEMRQGGFGNAELMDDAIAYVENADVPALREAMASGACSTSRFAFCHAADWLSRGLASDDPVSSSEF